MIGEVKRLRGKSGPWTEAGRSGGGRMRCGRTDIEARHCAVGTWCDDSDAVPPDVVRVDGRSQNMPSAMAEVTTETLQAFADAWNRHDVDALMSFMSADCVFEASAGPDACGTRYAGRDAVRAAFAEVWASFPDAHWGDARHFVSGDRGVSEWTFTGTRADGARVEVHGCDVFTFRDGKIALKNSYRKNRPPQKRV
jgi:steroid delta-isomerase-like uncharacterized protein